MSGNNSIINKSTNNTWIFNLLVGILLIILLPNEQIHYKWQQNILIQAEYVAPFSSASPLWLLPMHAITNNTDNGKSVRKEEVEGDGSFLQHVDAMADINSPIYSNDIALTKPLSLSVDKREIKNFQLPVELYFLKQNSENSESNDMSSENDNFAKRGNLLDQAIQSKSLWHHEDKPNDIIENVVERSTEASLKTTKLKDDAHDVTVLESGSDILDMKSPFIDETDDADIDIILESQDSNEDLLNNNNNNNNDNADKNNDNIGNENDNNVNFGEYENTENFEKLHRNDKIIFDENNNSRTQTTNEQPQQLYSNKYSNKEGETEKGEGVENSKTANKGSNKNENKNDNESDKRPINTNLSDRIENYDNDGSNKNHNNNNHNDNDNDTDDDDMQEFNWSDLSDESADDEGNAEYEKFKTMHQVKKQQLQQQRNLASLNAKKLLEWKLEETVKNNKNIQDNNYDVDAYKNGYDDDDENNANSKVDNNSNNINDNNIIINNNSADDIFAVKVVNFNATKRIPYTIVYKTNRSTNKTPTKTKMTTIATITTQATSISKGNSYSYIDVTIPPKVKRHKDDDGARFYDITNRYADNVKQGESVRVSSQEQTAFEKQKALKRNNHRNGHKIHKKRYKDYMRYGFVDVVNLATKTPKASDITAITKSNANMFNNNSNLDTNLNSNSEEQPENQNSMIKSYNPFRYGNQNAETTIASVNIPPIFTIKSKSNQSNYMSYLMTRKPFYEGQINYYTQTNDGKFNEEMFFPRNTKINKSVNKTINEDWLQKFRPVLRNAVRSSSSSSYADRNNHRKQHSSNKYKRYFQGINNQADRPPLYHRYHYHHRQHFPQYHRNYHQRNNQHKTNGNSKHNHYHHRKTDDSYLQSQKSYNIHEHHVAKNHLKYHPLTTTLASLLPLRGHVLTELGHQITDAKDLKYYYEKWPHLSDLPYQKNSDFYTQNYDYNQDNDKDDKKTVDETDKAKEVDKEKMDSNSQIEDENDDYLPPYIKKYKRRNQQLLNLLEGTLAPITKMPPKSLMLMNGPWKWSNSKLQPGPRDSSFFSQSRSSLSNINNDYWKKQQKQFQSYRYLPTSLPSASTSLPLHDDFFKEQRHINNSNIKTFTNATMATMATNNNSNAMNNNNKALESFTSRKVEENKYIDEIRENRVPDEDVNISMENISNDKNAGTSDESKTADTKEFSFNVDSNGNSDNRNENDNDNDDENDDDDVYHTNINEFNNGSGDNDVDDDDIGGDNESSNSWQKEIETKSKKGNSQKTRTSSMLTSLKAKNTNTSIIYNSYKNKAAYRKLPLYHNVAVNQLHSRSMHFAPSSGSKLRKLLPSSITTYPKMNEHFVNSYNNLDTISDSNSNNYKNNNKNNYQMTNNWTQRENHENVLPGLYYNIWQQTTFTTQTPNVTNNGTTTISIFTNKNSNSNNKNSNNDNNPNNNQEHSSTVSNSFEYHRVVDVSPRLLGIGNITGRKQRLPFVAITDRRLETSKKSPLEHQKYYQHQNLYPLP